MDFESRLIYVEVSLPDDDKVRNLDNRFLLALVKGGITGVAVSREGNETIIRIKSPDVRIQTAGWDDEENAKRERPVRKRHAKAKADPAP